MYVPYHNCIHNRLPADEPPDLKHVEDIIKYEFKRCLLLVYVVELYLVLSEKRRWIFQLTIYNHTEMRV